MPTGIVAATFLEARPLLQQTFPDRPDLKGKPSHRSPRTGGAELIRLPEGAMLLVSGMGPVRAALAARRLLENGATALVSWGFAGGLLSGLSPGMLLLPQKIHAADGSVYLSDPAWLAALNEALGGMKRTAGAVAESAGVLASRWEKERFGRRTGAAAVDMESGAVARSATESGTPFVALRVITDPSGADLPRSALHAADEFGRVRGWRLFLGLCRRPTEIAALARTLRGVRAAEGSLAEVVIRARMDLLRPPAFHGRGLPKGPGFPAGKEVS